MGQSLFAKSGFQGFLFAGGVITVIAAIASRFDDPQFNLRIVDRIAEIAVAALAVFVVALVLRVVRPNAFQLDQKVVSAIAEQWPPVRLVQDARGLMLLGLLIYVGYHFLDGTVVAADKVESILKIRLAMATIIIGLCGWSFLSSFRDHYTIIMTVATSIAGAGVGAMMLIAGPGVHFYYEGFIQVIAFAAFAFRLPPRALGIECAFLLAVYCGVLLKQYWVYGQGFVVDVGTRGVLTNNVVSLVTFVMLALATSISLARQAPPSKGAV